MKKYAICTVFVALCLLMVGNLPAFAAALKIAIVAPSASNDLAFTRASWTA